MLPDEERFCEDPYRGGWYRNINPKEHTYTPGYGFSPRPPAMVERGLIRGYSSAVGLCLLAFFFLSMVLPGALFWLLSSFVPAAHYPMAEESLTQLSLLVGAIVSLIAPFGLLRLYVRIPRENALPSRRVPLGLVVAAVLVGLAVAAVGMTASGVLEQVLQQLGLYFDSGSFAVPLSPVAVLLYAVNMTLVPAVFEEFAFRGVIMQSLRRFGDGFALLASALLFALAHVIPGKYPNAFLMGLVTGYFVMFTSSVWVGVAIHFTHNALLLAGMFLIPADQYFAFDTAILVYLVAGLVALLWLMRRYTGLFRLRSPLTINGEGQKFGAFFGTMPMVVLLLVVAIMAAGYVVTL